MSGFQAWHITTGRSVQILIPTSPVGPIHVISWHHERAHVPSTGTAFILPTEPMRVMWPGVDCFVDAGCYAVVPGDAYISKGAGLIIHTPQYLGQFQIGGPVEAVGRLKYIDGCSDSLLVCPPLVGEPCLNLLHLPKGTQQTRHTHPSDRIGIIVRGAGVCRTESYAQPLSEGMFWHIPTEFAHSFHTDEESLDVIAWHPDSDFGPSHDQHPMVNRTIVEGLPANDARHAAIRTT